MKIFLAAPRGFCAGVDRAIEIVQRALTLFGAPIYVRHEVVHNKSVVNDLKARGAIFIEEIAEAPKGSTLIFSAHGVSQKVRQDAKKRGCQVFDATCPLVTKVHMEVVRYSRAGKECILIGHAGHPEVEGTLGQYQNPAGAIYLVETVDDVANLEVKNPEALAYVSQTTLSVDDTAAIIRALKLKFPLLHSPKKGDICYATQNRQDAAKELAKHSDLVLVVGSRNSSNSNRLREIAEIQGCSAHLIDTAAEIQSKWLTGYEKIGVTAGASAPEFLVQEVIDRLMAEGATTLVQLTGREEKVVFNLPKELR